MFDEMIVNTTRDFASFIAMFVSGLITGVLFDIFRALRRVWKPGIKLTSFEDIIFLTLAFFIFTYSANIFSDTHLRWYIFVGAFLGTLLYFLILSKYFIFIFEKFFFFTSKTMSDIVTIFKKFILSPIKNFYQKIKLFLSSKKSDAKHTRKDKGHEKKISIFSKTSLQDKKNSL